MAKKIGLSLGNREIKAAAVIEETHADTLQNERQIENERKYTRPISRKQREKKDWKVKSVRIEAEDFKKVEVYMERKGINFNALIRNLFEKEGIL